MGGGASKKAAEPIAKEPTKKTQFAEAETGGSSPKQKGSAERRKTQTLRRPAVSTGAELSRKSEDFVATESIPMTPKSEEVTTALLEAWSRGGGQAPASHAMLLALLAAQRDMLMAENAALRQLNGLLRQAKGERRPAPVPGPRARGARPRSRSPS